jgi:RNA polymerase-binding transcription factor DksA
VSVNAEHEKQRALLEQERAQLAHRIDVLTVGGEVDMEFDDEFADRGQVAGKIGENLTIADSLEKQLALVVKALARIADGTYGSCTVCGNEIGSARLEALPAADLCITHA